MQSSPGQRNPSGFSRQASWLATVAGAARPVIRPLPTTIGVLALCASLLVIYATPLGPWVFSDSTEYIVSARNVLSGRGLGLIQASGEFQPIYLHPPLYPLILAGGGFLGIDVAAWARVLNAILFGGTVMLVAGLIHYATKSAWMAIASALTVAINPVMLRLYTGAMPEPVFFVAGLGAMLLLMSYWSLRTPWRLGAAGILCGVAILTRYPGVVFVAVGVLGLAFFGTAGLKRRTRDIGLFAVLALLPLVVWQAWLGSQYEVAFGRQWNFETGNLWQALVPFRIGVVTNVWGWIPYNISLPPVPYFLKPRLLLLAAGIMVALAAISVTSAGRRDPTPWRMAHSPQLLVLSTASAVLNLGILAGAVAYTLPALDLGDIDSRILLPTQIGLTLAAFTVAHLTLRAWPKWSWIRWLESAALILFLSWYLSQSWEFVADMRQDGAGYTSRAWRNSPTLKAIENLPPDLPLISSESAALTFLLDRPAYDIPELVRGEETRPFVRFGDGQDLEERLFREQGAALVFFDLSYGHFFQLYEDETEQRLQVLVHGLREHGRYADGAIYFYPSSEE